MPKYAARKLINEGVCLPIQTTKTTATKVTETIIVKSSLSDLQNSTPTKATTIQQQNEQNSKQEELSKATKLKPKQQQTNRRQRRKRRNRSKPKKSTTTTATTNTESSCITGEDCVESTLPKATTTTAQAKSSASTINKKPIKSRSKRPISPPYFSTLYPIVIETCSVEAQTQTGNLNSKTSIVTASTTSSSGLTGVGIDNTPTPNRTVVATAAGRRRLRRRRSVTHFTKRKNKSKAKSAPKGAERGAVVKVQIKSKETVARLATLRNRNKLKESEKDNNKKKSKGLESGNDNCEPQVKRHAAWYNLDELLLNKIEPLEVEVKKGGGKRKRDSSVAAARKRNIITHKHTPPPAPLNFDFAAIPAADIITSSTIVPNQLSLISPPFSIELPNCVSSLIGGGSSSTTSNNNNNNNNCGNNANVKKRARGGMSLHERRYQTTDVEGRGGGGVGGVGTAGTSAVANGYHNSSRNPSGSSSVMHSDIDNGQDITQQYYMPAITESSNSIAGVSSSSGSSAVVATQLGNGSTLNHAPSMATLCNIGNTCYLNSVVYTLRFAPQFLHNLHHLIVDLSSIQQCIARQRAAKSSSLGRGISAVQLENSRSWSSKDLAALEQNALLNTGGGGGGLGGCGGGIGQKSSHQMLTERLHELYQCLHRNEVAESTEPFHADTLLHAVQDVNAIFEGNQQQDAHEFLMCLLNSIRETCQLLIKAIGEYPDLIMNGYIRNPDDLDAYTFERDISASTNSNNALGSSATANNANNLTSSSSLSTSNITKASFFSRKSKRKEESKNSKNSRLQSPLMDRTQSGLQSNSLFYLNFVDLSGGTSSSTSSAAGNNATITSTNTSASSPNAIAKGLTNSAIDSNSELSSPVSMLKDKERLSEKIRELGLDFFSEDFEGVTVSTTKCLSCETITEQKESMIDIAVPVPISGFEDKPSSFIQNSCVTREVFGGENKYRCEQCTGYTEAIRSISYEVLPRLLVIQLSRFSGGMEKINSYIPTSFTLQCFCAKCCELSDANKLHIYKLYSVITHVGATMSVGHYIAYTSSLEWANEYVNCPKDRRNANSNCVSQMGGQTNGLSNSSLYPLSGTGSGCVGGGGGNGSATSGGGSTPNDRSSPGAQAASAASAAASVLASSGSSLMKKMKFGRNKASSSGDMTKNVKNLNGITSKAITNGIGKLSMNTTCHSLNCCATRICSVQQQQQQQQLSASNNELNEETLQNGSNYMPAIMSVSGSSNTGGIGGGSSGTGSAGSSTTSGYSSYQAGYGSTGRGSTKTNAFGGPYASSCGSLSAMGSSGNGSSNSNNNEPIWYMCDDDKIKAMTQREFEELLSPARKITVTPYLLFYARFDLQTSTPPSAKSTCGNAPQQSASWSNENLTLQQQQQQHSGTTTAVAAAAAALHKM